ncbi:MAG: carbohydrate ABC transporter permease, partial [Firmicutes bacterium]|nr:carbohydrate ABC transporter permease [Bacillota bacterium]
IYAFQGLWGQGSTNLIYSEQLKTLNYAIGQILSAGITRTGASCASTVIMMMVPIIVFIVSQSNVIETMGTSGMKD